MFAKPNTCTFMQAHALTGAKTKAYMHTNANEPVKNLPTIIKNE